MIYSEEYDILESGGIRYYYKKGTETLHRLNGPAIDYGNGQYNYYVNGKQHREDGPATFVGGTERWYLNGVLHREDGPAEKTASGRIKYYKYGKLHRLDGPAYTYKSSHGLVLEFYYIEGVRIVGEKERLLKLWYNLQKDK